MPTEFYKYICIVDWRDKNRSIRTCLLGTGLVKYIEEMKRTVETTPRFIASRGVKYCGSSHWGVFHEIGVMKFQTDVQEFA